MIAVMKKNKKLALICIKIRKNKRIKKRMMQLQRVVLLLKAQIILVTSKPIIS